MQCSAHFPVNLLKRVWNSPQQEFFGMVVDRIAMHPAEFKVDADAQLSSPAKRYRTSRLFDMTGFLRDLVPCYSALAAPLTNLSVAKHKFACKRMQDCNSMGYRPRASFSGKAALVSTPVLAITDRDHPFMLHADASADAAGTALIVHRSGTCRYICQLQVVAN